jgi:hypothetical protein
MRVEMAIDADFAVPAVTKELGDEMKAAKVWLQGLAMVSAPQFLDRNMQPIAPEQGPIASGGSLLMIEDVPREAAQDKVRVFAAFHCSS